MERDSNAHSYGVDQIVADQTGCDCDRKLGSGSRQKPMLFIGRAAVHGVPPAVDKTCCDCQHDEKREPPARSVKKSVPVRANCKVGPSQKEIRKVKQRKRTAEKLVAHKFMVATQCRPCRRAVPAR